MVDIQFAVAAAANQDILVIAATDTPVIANTSEVQTGSTINGFFCSIEVVNTGSAGVLANCYVIFYKNPGGNTTLPAANLVGASDNKRFVIHQEMVMLQMQDNSNPRTLFKGVIAIPKGYRRFAPNDTLIARVTSPGVEITGCAQFHYKEFR